MFSSSRGRIAFQQYLTVWILSTHYELTIKQIILVAAAILAAARGARADQAAECGIDRHGR